MWTRLSSPTDWEAYVRKTAEILHIPIAQIEWGRGPQRYPCLVSSHMPPSVPGSTPRLYSAYVYPDDARVLLGEPPPQSQVVAPAAAPAVGPTQANFNRWLTAQMLTVVHFLVETGICKPGPFEDKLLEFVEEVDLWRKEQTDELRTRLGRAGTTVLESLDSAG